MWSTVAEAPATLGAALAALEAAAAQVVAAIDAGGLAEVGHDGLGEAIVGICGVVDRCESYLRCVGQVDAAGSFGVDGALSTTSWLRWRARLTGPAAAIAVRTARELDTRLPKLAQLLAEGEVSVETARVVAIGVRGTCDADAAALEPRAIAVRDGDTCCWPGCELPADWTEAHHTIHWIDRGPTEVTNGLLPCKRHHTQLHGAVGHQPHRELATLLRPTSRQPEI